MQARIQFFAIAGSLTIAIFIFELIRKRKLQERYSLLWFSSAIILIVMSVWRGLLEKTASFLGVYYAPSALFIIAAFFGMLLALHFTIVISKLTEQNKILAQELSLLREELRQNTSIPEKAKFENEKSESLN
ncbi:MAG: DUF2304 domain-containing protein [Calditrichaeota bacterium]|nr:MAG: DUF2304 domain-containing protein [Calditrichota bacterium]